MKTVDLRIGNPSVELLRGVIGKRILSITHDSFLFSNSVYGAAMLNVGGSDSGDTSYELLSSYELCNYFGDQTDACRFSFRRNDKPGFHSQLEGASEATDPVDKTLRDVVLVNDKQVMSQPEKEEFAFCFTKAIVLVFGGLEVAFEQVDATMPQIRITRSPNALHELDAPDSDFDDMERSYMTATREFVSLKSW